MTIPSTIGDGQSTLDQLLLEFDDLIAAGKTTPTLEDYVKRYPQLAGELRSYFEDRGRLRKRAGLLCALAGTGAGELPPFRSFGKYEVLRTEGEGGMGIVVRAVDVVVKREVVLKVLKPSGQENPEALRRFKLEGQLLGQLEHPAIVALHEMGEMPDQKKLPYLAMKLVRGHTLDWLLKRRETLESRREWFLDVFVQVCRAVHYAHGKRVLHRDLKPGNVMVGEHQEVQLTDFGLAKVMNTSAGAPNPAGGPSATVAAQTAIGAAPGTPLYMAPEQARGEQKTLDARCDVFGLGGILCEILTGEPTRTLADVAILLRDLRDPGQLSLAGSQERLRRCGGPASLIELCKRCLAFEPSERPASAEEVANAVLDYRASLAKVAHDKELEAASATVRADAAAKRQKLAYGLLAAAVLLTLSTILIAIISGAAFWINQRRQAAARELVLIEDANNAAVLRQTQAAKALRAEAQDAPLEQIEALFQKALVQAKNADEQARKGPAAAKVKQLAAAALQEAEAEVAAAAKDRRVVARLLEMMVFGASPSASSGQAPLNAEEGYAAAFRAWGLDPDRVPIAEAAARIRARPTASATELIAALDHWAYLRRVQYMTSAPRLFDLASAADRPTPLRQELREMLADSEPPGGGDPALNSERVRALALKVQPESEPALTLLVLARVLGEIGDNNEALTLLDKGALASPREALLWGQLGQLHMLLGGIELVQQTKTTPERPVSPTTPMSPHFQEAVACAKVLVSMRPEAKFMLATALLNTPQAEQGRSLLRELKHERGNDADLQFQADCTEIQNLFLSGKLAEAAVLLEKITRDRPKDDASHQFRLMAANIHLLKGELNKTVELCEEITRSSKSPLLLAGAYETQGKANALQRNEVEMFRNFTEASRLSQGIPSGHVFVAQGVERSNNLQGAKNMLAAGLQQDPKNAALLVYVVEFQRRQGNEAEALTVQKQLAQAEFPSDARSLYKLGCGLLRIGEPALAVQAFEKYLKLDPERVTAHKMLQKARGHGRQVWVFFCTTEHSSECTRFDSRSFPAYSSTPPSSNTPRGRLVPRKRFFVSMNDRSQSQIPTVLNKGQSQPVEAEWEVLDRFSQELQQCDQPAAQVRLLLEAVRESLGADCVYWHPGSGSDRPDYVGQPHISEDWRSEFISREVARAPDHEGQFARSFLDSGPKPSSPWPCSAALVRIRESRGSWLVALSYHPSRLFQTVDLKVMRLARRLLLNHRQHRQVQTKLKDSLFGLVHCLTAAIDARDAYTWGHSERVGRLAVRLGKQMGLPLNTLNDLYLAGLLHDVGKVGIRGEVLSNPARLSDEDMAHVREHPVIGDRLVANFPQLDHLRAGVRNHHERWDGLGYPDRLEGKDIPQLARILAVVESCDAMLAARPYRPALKPARLEVEFRAGAGKQWDPTIVEFFLSCRHELYAICQRGQGDSVALAMEAASHGS